MAIYIINLVLCVSGVLSLSVYQDVSSDAIRRCDVCIFYEVAISCDFRCIWSVSVCRPNYASSIASNAGISTGFNAKGDLCVTMYISLQTLERERVRERVKRDEE